ncbi:MAG: hypothetical protein IPP91_08740 [Betaproteobacteria bacterium]|nr:hypothetical protein [Betaproteobacteria bacterium]
MKMIMKAQPFEPARYDGWHILTPANGPVEDAGEDAHSVMAALPLWLASDHEFARTPEALKEFKRHLAEFVRRNKATIRARRIVINLYDAPRPLPFDYVKAIQQAFVKSAPDRIVDHVVIYTNLLA